MAGSRLDQEIADRNLAGFGAVVLTHVLTGSYPLAVQAVVFFGSDAKPLDGTAGTWTLNIAVTRYLAANAHVNDVSYAFTAGVRKWVVTPMIMMEPGDTLLINAISPNGADTDVGVTANLYDATVALPGVAPGAEYGLPTVDANNHIAGIAGSVTTFDGLKSVIDWQVIPGANYDGSTLRVAAALAHHGQAMSGASLSACTWKVFDSAGTQVGTTITGTKDSGGFFFYGSLATEALTANTMYVLETNVTYGGTVYTMRTPMPLNA